MAMRLSQPCSQITHAAVLGCHQKKNWFHDSIAYYLHWTNRIRVKSSRYYACHANQEVKEKKDTMGTDARRFE